MMKQPALENRVFSTSAFECRLEHPPNNHWQPNNLPTSSHKVWQVWQVCKLHLLGLSNYQQKLPAVIHRHSIGVDMGGMDSMWWTFDSRCVKQKWNKIRRRSDMLLFELNTQVTLKWFEAGKVCWKYRFAILKVHHGVPPLTWFQCYMATLPFNVCLPCRALLWSWGSQGKWRFNLPWCWLVLYLGWSWEAQYFGWKEVNWLIFIARSQQVPKVAYVIMYWCILVVLMLGVQGKMLFHFH